MHRYINIIAICNGAMHAYMSLAKYIRTYMHVPVATYMYVHGHAYKHT